MSSGMRIELLNREGISDEMIHCAIGIGGGMINREFLIGDDGFISSYAFGHLILGYLREACNDLRIRIELLRSCEVIAFKADTEHFGPAIKKILSNLFENVFSQEIFEKAKKHCLDAFEANYSNARFRALIKSYEFSDLHKKFTLTAYLDDLKAIDFETFTHCADKLLRPCNVCIYLLSENIETVTDLLKEIREYRDDAVLDVSAMSHEYDPFLRQDAHISNLARENATVIIEAFEFLNRETAPFAKLLVLDFLASIIDEQNVMVYADRADASMIIETDKIKSFKSLLNKRLSQEEFETAKAQLLKKYIYYLKYEPGDLAIRSVEMAFSGIFMDQYLSELSACSYEEFLEIAEQSQYMISEAQIALRKEPENV